MSIPKQAGGIKNLRPDRILVTLGDKERELRYDLNAFAELEKRFGSVEAAMAALQKGSILTIRTLLWTGLIHSEAILDEVTGEPISYSITPFEVGSWIDPRMLQGISEKLGIALREAMPDSTISQPTSILEEELVDDGLPKMAVVVYTPEQQAEIDSKND
jgi:hypothetical protein